MPNIRSDPEYVQRVEDSYRSLSSYKFNRSLLTQGVPSSSLRDRLTLPLVAQIDPNRELIEHLMAAWMGKHHRISHTGDFPKFPLDSLPTPPFGRIQLRPDPTARNIDDHWYEWLWSESRWGQQNFAIVGLDLRKMDQSGIEPRQFHRGHFYNGRNYYELFTAVNEPRELIKIGRQPIPIGVLAVDTHGEELPMRVFDYTTRNDKFYSGIPWE